MKIVLFGASEIAYLIASEYHEKNDVIIIDKEEKQSNDFSKLDVSIVKADILSFEILKQIDIKSANAFIACTASDEANILACFSVKRLSEAKTICFIKQSEYKKDLTCLSETDGHSLYIDYVIWPEELLTKEIFRIITVAKALDVENFANGKARLLEYKIEEDSILVNKIVKNCEFPPNTLIVGVTKGEDLYIPYGDTVLEVNDKIIFMGLSNSLDVLAAKFFHGAQYNKSVVLIGGGTVGCMLAKQLEGLKLSVKIIEKDLKRCEELSQILSNALIINGDATNLELLMQEEVELSDVIVSVTDSDEKNLLCSLLTNQMGIKKIVSRVSKMVNVSLFEKVGIDIAISPMEAALHEVKNCLSPKCNVDILATVEKGKGEVLEIVIGEDFQQCKLMDLKLPKRAVVGMIYRNNKIIIPKGDTLIFPKDEILIFTIKEFSPVIKEFFKAR